jgi:hypothetical protein
MGDVVQKAVADERKKKLLEGGVHKTEVKLNFMQA